MKVSVIIPAYNTSATLGDTLDSILVQTVPDWEAIVVNDGSTDDTRKIAEAFAVKDARIRVISQSNGGESAARNAGIENAACDWLAFLDSDDWVAPAWIELLTAAVETDPTLDAVHCGWARVTADGKQVREKYRPPAGNLFPVFARRAAFAVHACIVRKELVDSVGRFDTTLKTCPDWDLWQRVARAGAKFGSIPETLAFYRMTANSASLNAEQLFRDGLRVLRTGHGPDPRVPNPCPEFANGLADSTVNSQAYYLLCWNAGLMLGAGKPPGRLLKILGKEAWPGLYADAIAQCIFESATLPSSGSRNWDDFWRRVEKPLGKFLAALEAQSQSPDLAARAMTELKKMVLRNSATWGPVFEQEERNAEALTAANRSLAGKETELVASLDRANSGVRLLENELNDSRERVTRLGATLNSANEKIRSAEARKVAVETQLSESYERVAGLERESSELTAALDRANSGARLLESDLTDSREQVSRLGSTLETANEKIRSVEAEKIALETQLNELRARAAGLERESTELTVALDRANSGARLAEGELADSREQAGKLRAALDAANARLSESREQATGLAAALDTANEKILSVGTEKTAVESCLRESRERAADLDRKSADLAEALAFESSRARQLDQDLDASRRNVADLTSSLTESRRLHEIEKTEKATLQLNLRDSAEHIRALTQRQTELLRELEQAAEKILNLRARGDLMESELNEWKQRAERLEQEKAFLTAELLKWRQSCDERGLLIEEIQQEPWVRFGHMLRMVKHREIRPATIDRDSLPQAVSGEVEDAHAGWELRVSEGNEAHVIYPAHDHQMVSVGITQAGTSRGWDIQLNRAATAVRSGESYVISFRARAARPRKIGVGFAMAHEPWSSLGFYQTLRLTPEWQTFREEFTPPESDDITRIHFDLGGKNVGIDVTELSLERVESPDSGTAAAAGREVA